AINFSSFKRIHRVFRYLRYIQEIKITIQLIIVTYNIKTALLKELMTTFPNSDNAQVSARMLLRVFPKNKVISRFNSIGIKSTGKPPIGSQHDDKHLRRDAILCIGRIIPLDRSRNLCQNIP